MKYTIRVYGIWINEQNKVLLSDERIGDTKFTKFPGGGMERGEGPIDCLKREWQEELNTDIEILEHFYTTDFYQASAFHKETQVISIYYKVHPLHQDAIEYTNAKNNFSYMGKSEEKARFVSLSCLQEEDVSFPIDRHVVRLLKKRAH